MLQDYDDRYQRVFRAAFDAGVRSAEDLPDEDVEHLRRYTGVVGLVAEHVALTRERSQSRSEAARRRA